jgi:hypothetical protein
MRFTLHDGSTDDEIVNHAPMRPFLAGQMA